MSFNRKEEEVMIYILWDGMTCFYYFRKNGVAARRGKSSRGNGRLEQSEGWKGGLTGATSEQGRQ